MNLTQKVERVLSVHDRLKSQYINECKKMHRLAYVNKHNLCISTLNFMSIKEKNNTFHCNLIGSVGELQDVFVCVCVCVRACVSG